MFRSHFRIALKHLITQRFYSALNILGLAVGLACFIVIALYAGSAVLALAVALLTVGTIAARAATTNPIHSLRYE